jgi:hypothetical protein
VDGTVAEQLMGSVDVGFIKAPLQLTTHFCNSPRGFWRWEPETFSFLYSFKFITLNLSESQTLKINHYLYSMLSFFDGFNTFSATVLLREYISLKYLHPVIFTPVFGTKKKLLTKLDNSMELRTIREATNHVAT